jgi:hypothetical protein
MNGNLPRSAIGTLWIIINNQGTSTGQSLSFPFRYADCIRDERATQEFERTQIFNNDDPSSEVISLPVLMFIDDFCVH